MNNENLHRIFDDTACISTEKMIDYLDGSLLEKEKNSVELHLSSCTMCFDEFEGLQMISDKSTLPETVFELNDKVDTILASSRKKIPFLLPINLMAAIILFIIGFAWYVTYYINASLQLKEEMIAQAFEIDLQRSDSEIIIFRPDPTLYENKADNVATKNNKLLSDNKTLAAISDLESKSNKKEEVVVLEEESKNNELLDENNAGIVSSERMIVEDAKISNDKSKISKEDEEKNVVELFDDIGVADSNKEITSNYDESKSRSNKKTALNKAKNSAVLSNTVRSDNFNLAMAEYDKRDFREAIELFKQSLNEDGPRDKVYFYLALSYENIKSQQEALSNYNKVISNAQSTYYEQSLWNKSQILLQIDKRKSAINSLNQIKTLNGKYAKQAEKMLDSLNNK